MNTIKELISYMVNLREHLLNITVFRFRAVFRQSYKISPIAMGLSVSVCVFVYV